MTVELWIGIAALVVHALSITGAGIWQLSKTKDELKDEIVDHRMTLAKEVESDRRATVQIVQALTTRIYELELASYKTFVRRDSFHEIMNRASAENAAYKQAIEARLDRQEAKIDKLIEVIARASRA